MTAVIDAHHHLLDPDRFEYPWLTSDLAAIDRPSLPADLAPHLLEAGVDHTVVVQTIASPEETLEFLRVARDTPWVAGVIGWADLTAPDLPAVIGRLREAPGGEHLVGLRHQVHDEADPDWLARPDVDRGLRAIADVDLTYDLLIRTREVPSALGAIRRHPRLRFVVDHLAKPPIVTGDLGAWADALTPIAAEPNVFAKLSGLVTEADWGRWRPDDLTEAVELALALFGPERLIFGSDWPVCLLAATYATVVDTARWLTAGRSESERAEIFGGSARRAYPGLIAADGV